MACVHNSHTARVLDAVTHKHILLGHIPIAMAQGQHTLTLPKEVAPHDIVARLDGHHLHLAIAVIKHIVLNHHIR